MYIDRYYHDNVYQAISEKNITCSLLPLAIVTIYRQQQQLVFSSIASNI